MRFAATVLLLVGGGAGMGLVSADWCDGRSTGQHCRRDEVGMWTLSVSLPLCRSVCLSVGLSFSLSLCLPVCLHFPLSVSLSLCVSVSLLLIHARTHTHARARARTHTV